MKKCIVLFLALFITVLTPICASAQGEYAIDSATGTLISYTGPGGDIVIPNVVDGTPVKALGTALFNQNAAITSVKVPEGVKRIEQNAFYFCSALRSVSLPESLQVIDRYAFFSCEKLTEIILPSRVHTLGDSAFAFCESLSSVVFLGEAPLMGEEVFSSATNAPRTYTVPANALEGYQDILPEPLQQGASCTPLDHAVPKEQLTFDAATGTITGYLGDDAYLKLPEEIGGIPVTAIGPRAFFARKDIRRIHLPKGISSLEKEAFFAARLAELKLPETLQHIGEGALGALPMKSLALPDSLQSLAEKAFSGSQLRNITLPEGIKTIPGNVFSGCTWLEDLVLPSSLENIGKEAFLNCSSLSYIVFHGYTLPQIAPDAFAGCDKLTDIDLPMDATREQAQVAKTLFETLGYGEGLTVWRANPPDQPPYPPNGTFTAFDKDTGIISGYTGSLDAMTMYWTFDQVDVRGIGPETFKGAAIKAFSVPHSEGFTTIGERAFMDSQLESIHLFDSITHIGAEAFKNCINLKEIVVPEHVEFIGANAFEGCINLEKVVFKGGAPKIGMDAFKGCSSLKEVVLPARAMPENSLGLSPHSLRIAQDATEEETAALQAALQFPWYLRLSKEGDPDTFAKMPDSPNPEGDFEFDAQTGTLSKYIGTSPLCVIPRQINGVDVAAIGTSAFSNLSVLSVAQGTQDNTSLSQVVIPETVTSIADSAFLNCTTLRQVDCYGPIDLVGIRAFEGCESLETITFHNGVKELGLYAFNLCENLKEAVLGDYIQTIAEGAFYGCGFETLVMDRQHYADFAYQNNAKVTTVHVLPRVQSIGNLMFNGMPLLKEVYMEGGDASILSSYGMHFPQDNADFKVYIPMDASEETYKAFVTVLNQNALDGESIVKRRSDAGLQGEAPVAAETTLPAQQEEIPASDTTARAQPLDEAAAQPFPLEAPATQEVPSGEVTDKMYVCVKAEAAGVAVDIALIGRYDVQFLSDGSAKMTIGGTAIGPLTWAAEGDTLVADFYGTKYTFQRIGDTLQMDYFGAMLLTYQAQ